MPIVIIINTGRSLNDLMFTAWSPSTVPQRGQTTTVRTYSFTKLLTPNTTGQPTAKPFDRSRKLAYVCFSRVKTNLRILLFTPNPQSAKQELVEQNLLSKEYIQIAQ